LNIPLLPFPKIAARATSDHGVRDDWVASEKIHGAQLVVGSDGVNVRFGKRKAWLEADSAFFGWQLLRRELDRAVRVVHELLAVPGNLWIYGELFGGRYPHPAVKPFPGLVPVQTGIWYAADLRYAVFDMVHALDGQEPGFLAHDRVRSLAHAGGLMLAPELSRAHRSELAALPVRFQTRVPGLLGLPPLQHNDAEGYVLKPTAELPISARPCVKAKIPEFDEQRFDASSAFDPDVRLTRDAWFELAARLVNPARIASARSKVGADARAVVEEVVLDALVDLCDLAPRQFNARSAALELELSRHLAETAEALLESEEDAQR